MQSTIRIKSASAMAPLLEPVVNSAHFGMVAVFIGILALVVTVLLIMLCGGKKEEKQEPLPPEPAPTAEEKKPAENPPNATPEQTGAQAGSLKLMTEGNVASGPAVTTPVAPTTMGSERAASLKLMTAAQR
ncbi:dehydrogenase complex E2 component, dihydrolipamide acetyltransferase [Trichinella spiralis]|uniref:dehydrogenase complex E2 component, dihydrolipamide acetyltransferase n=1 Tax=Trichinella spiralis TaxID=6334 RepID=UPI0001EFB64C|nr:dehydrogenase complex E2 component, dihydrolipamide acetyltransferase [Trichinella spiralis]